MKRALIVVDVQNEYFEGGALPIMYPPNSFEQIKTAISEAQKRVNSSFLYNIPV